MSNFTQSVLSNLCLVTASDLTPLSQDQPSLSQEVEANLEHVKSTLNTVSYSPRKATLQLIFDYAANTAPQDL
ncbi:hypothetical protein CLV59_102599 [Chitinophaga dinghuensis]|uniref:Uncharacterized protein n=1 Tax=Chitinophaga dinghuensis TaxID=1539050 RepID=A0A327W9I1_9BACT|nr:hypothetical protein [Chitinophaga dinghuensis]RAJ85892.1 hypothetical protein CLV59_102599 [Chitinophaga dinghuensis]